MGEVKNKVEGTVKEAAGKAIGDNEIEARGRGQKTVGEVQGGVREVKGKVEEAIGKAVGSPSREASGKAKQA
ncbi:MAG: CsbD-like [Chloroflexota bacterium]|jgi:uncharacterized protein YjbJ (UPF0337 family)|nr:CsbD-like [Chloroflexota bacterium]